MQKKFKQIAEELSCMFLERDNHLTAIARAFLAGEHIVLLGVPGTAKSAMIAEFCSRITGVKYFETLLQKMSGVEDVFGPLDIPGLQAGKYERLVDGFLPAAHVGFLDEVWKANSAILNALLTLVNERKYRQGTSLVSAPLVSLVCASNETPNEPILAAIYDRIMFRRLVHPVSDQSFTALINPQSCTRGGNVTTISLEEWETARGEVKKVQVPNEILEDVAELKNAAKAEGFIASDRRWRASIKGLQAAAYLEGRNHVIHDDLLIYGDILWDDMEREGAAQALVRKHVSPGLARLMEHIDAAQALIDSLQSTTSSDKKMEILMKCREHEKSARDIQGVGEAGTIALARYQASYKNALSKIMGLGK